MRCHPRSGRLASFAVEPRGLRPTKGRQPMRPSRTLALAAASSLVVLAASVTAADAQRIVLAVDPPTADTRLFWGTSVPNVTLFAPSVGWSATTPSPASTATTGSPAPGRPTRTSPSGPSGGTKARPGISTTATSRRRTSPTAMRCTSARLRRSRSWSSAGCRSPRPRSRSCCPARRTVPTSGQRCTATPSPPA